MAADAGIFEILRKFFLPRVTAEEKYLRTHAEKVLTGPRGRKIFLLNVSNKWDDALTRAWTSPLNGSTYVYSETWRDAEQLAETLRHEGVHSVLVPKLRPLGFAKRTAKSVSPLLRYLEEGAAHTYATRSFREGFKFPIKYDYVSIPQLMRDPIVLAPLFYGEYRLIEGATDDDH